MPGDIEPNEPYCCSNTDHGPNSIPDLVADVGSSNDDPVVVADDSSNTKPPGYHAG